MSSYQFVNSLTSCYGQRSQDSSSQDYYTPQVQSYGGCYSGPGSPVQQYGPYPQHSVPHLQNGDHHFNSCSQTRLNNPSQSPRTPTPSVTPVPSCKYAEPSAASPQDLSTSGGHQPGSPAESRTSPQPARQQTSPTQQSSTQQSSAPQQTSTQQTPQGPQDSASPQAGQQQKTPYPTNPPQIYPWMRKVHVGQSKSFIISSSTFPFRNFSFFFCISMG